MRVRERAITLLGHPAVERCAASLSGTRLRIIAYHDVPDASVLHWHLQHLAARYRVVAGATVHHALVQGRPLPAGSIWLTFDDAHPAVFEKAQPLLTNLGLTATVYACPGVVDSTEPYWWDIAREAARHGLTTEVDRRIVHPSQLEARLKRCADPTRRSVIERLRARLEEEFGRRVTRRQATSDQLRAWLAAGHEVGNHTWDHPCLDRCEPDEARRQVVAAHDWLRVELGAAVATFAYPNGNWSAAAEGELRRLGYRTAVGFDHRLVRRRSDRLRLSRLRLDADAPPTRVRALISGAQPMLMAGRDRLRDRRTRGPRLLPR